MLATFLHSLKLYCQLCLQSLKRREDIGNLTLGGRLVRILLYLAFTPILLFHWLCLFLDEIFFRGYRQQIIEKPVFILGVPRSGTTFLHRTMAEDSRRYSSVSTWEVFLAPSILQRKIVLFVAGIDRLIGSPLARIVRWLETKLFKGLEGVHDVALEAAEEDYLLLLPILSCFILFLPFPESSHIWNLARFDWQADQKSKQRIMSFYRASLQKHLYVHGKGRCYLSKNAAFASWPKALHETFPDARFIICMREPHKAIPSLLGSLEGGARFFQLDLSKGRMPDMLVGMMQKYYQHLLREFPVPAPIIHMAELKTDVSGVIASIYAGFGDEITPEYAEKLVDLKQQASQYRTQTQAIQPGVAAQVDYYHSRFPWYYEVPEAGNTSADSPTNTRQNETQTHD